MHDTAATAEPDYLTVRQAAKRLRVSTRVVYELISGRELQATQVRSLLRVRPDAVTAYLAAQPADEDICEIAEAARILQVHERTVRELILDGDVTTVKKLGHRGRLITRQSLSDYLARAAIGT